MRARLPISASRFSSAFAPAETPMTAIRPPVASARGSSARLGAPTSSRITSKGPCSAKPSGAIDSAPSARDLRAQLARCARSRSLVRRPRARAGSPRSRRRRRRRARAAARPGAARACVKSASWAVVNTSGRPPAAGQSSTAGTAHQQPLVHDRELRLGPAADDPHHPLADRKAPRAGPERGDLARRTPCPGCPAASPAAPGRARAAASCRRRSVRPRAPARAPRPPRHRVGVLLDHDLPLADRGGAHRPAEPTRRRRARAGVRAALSRRSNRATHSMWWVWGNMSTGRTLRSVQPACTSSAAFGRQRGGVAGDVDDPPGRRLDDAVDDLLGEAGARRVDDDARPDGRRAASSSGSARRTSPAKKLRVRDLVAARAARSRPRRPASTSSMPHSSPARGASVSAIVPIPQ